MFKKILEKIYTNYDKKTFAKEDAVVLKFLKSQTNKNTQIKYLEVGSGLCRFPLLIKNKYKDINIKGIEINNNLVDIGIKNNLDIVQGDIEKTTFSNDEFDIIHCSHVIEHLDYKKITNALDEMLRILKTNGCLIIRTPLLYPGFYFDIDHIRPYPPEAILNYFNNTQQQKKSSYKILEISRWYRNEAFLFDNTNNIILKLINVFSRFLWTLVGLPSAKPNAYTLILKKYKILKNEK